MIEYGTTTRDQFTDDHKAVYPRFDNREEAQATANKWNHGIGHKVTPDSPDWAFVVERQVSEWKESKHE